MTMFQNPELNLQTELVDLLFTDKDCSPIKIPLIHKRIRNDTNNSLLRCSCTSNNYNEGLLRCPYCKGFGYLYDEVIIEGYIHQGNASKFKHMFDMTTEAGVNEKEVKLLFTPSTINIKAKDAIKTLSLLNNKIKIPLEVLNVYRVYYTNKLRASTNDTDYNVSLLMD